MIPRPMRLRLQLIFGAEEKPGRPPRSLWQHMLMFAAHFFHGSHRRYQPIGFNPVLSVAELVVSALSGMRTLRGTTDATDKDSGTRDRDCGLPGPACDGNNRRRRPAANGESRRAARQRPAPDADSRVDTSRCSGYPGSRGIGREPAGTGTGGPRPGGTVGTTEWSTCIRPSQCRQHGITCRCTGMEGTRCGRRIGRRHGSAFGRRPSHRCAGGPGCACVAA
jgi:hypothetical protein